MPVEETGRLGPDTFYPEGNTIEILFSTYLDALLTSYTRRRSQNLQSVQPGITLQ